MNPTLLAKIRDTQSLPTLPAAALRVLQVTQDDRIGMNELGQTIASDPALASKVLRAVNSTLYCLPQKVVSVPQAVALLGLHSVRTLVLGFSLSAALKSPRATGFNHIAYWRRSMYAATAARVVAGKVLEGRVEECFVAALLMDFGALLLDQLLGEEYGAVCERARTHADLLILETHALGMTHAEAGGLLAQHWRLPEVLRVPIAAHHGPQQVEEVLLRQVAEIVCLAGRIADVFVNDAAAESISAVRESFRRLYGMTEIGADALLCQIGQKTAELAPLFDVRLNSSANYDSIVERASERLLELSLALQQQQQQHDGRPVGRRRAERVRRDGKINITPCSQGILGRPVQVRLKDLSAIGIGVVHTDRLEPGTQFVIQLPQKGGEVKNLLYTVRRCDSSGGVWSIGAELAAVLRPEQAAAPQQVGLAGVA